MKYGIFLPIYIASLILVSCDTSNPYDETVPPPKPTRMEIVEHGFVERAYLAIFRDKQTGKEYLHFDGAMVELKPKD